MGTEEHVGLFEYHLRMRNNWTRWLAVSLFLIIGCLSLRVAAQSPALFAQVNSRYDEQAPFLSPDGQELYFGRNGHPNNIGFEDLPDIWLSRRKPNGQWGPPIHLGLPINDLRANRLAGLTADGNALYLAETDGYQSWVTVTRREGRHWTAPLSTIIERFVPGAGATFSVSPDEQFLIIASEQPEGLGSLDLYVAFRLEDRLWSHPIHMGSRLNTPGREEWAMIAADGQTLYFASDGHPGGAGGLDLWMSRRQDANWQEWSPPVNLGSAVNSSADELNLAIAGDGASVIVSRLIDQQAYDLQQVPLDADKQPFSIAILSGQLLSTTADGAVFYRFLGDEGGQEQRLQLHDDGSYRVIVPLNRGIAFYGNFPGYMPLSERFDGIPLADKLDTPNPQIAAWAGMNTYYWQQERIIHDLRNQLQLVQEEKENLNRKKRIHRRLLAEKTFEELESEKAWLVNPEIEALERRFNIYQRRLRDTLTTVGPQDKRLSSMQPRGASTGEAKKDYIEEPSDEATLELKSQLREYSSTRKNPPAGIIPGRHASDDNLLSFSFRDLRKRAEKEVTYALLPRVQAELVQELFPMAWRGVQQNTSASILKELIEREDSIRIQIRQGLGQFILAPDPFLNDSGDEDQEWWLQMKSDLKNLIRQPIRAELKQNLRTLVFEAVQLELDYQVRQLVEEHQRRLLNEKIEQQMKIETASEEVGLYLDQIAPKMAPGAGTDTLDNLILVEKDFVLIPIEEGQILRLKNTTFIPDQSTLNPDSHMELDSIAQFLKNNKEIQVEIRSHTHGWCDHAKANQLTEARARLLYDYFVSQGVSPARIQYKGLGKTQPVADNKTLEGRALNQRIELKILQDH